MGYREIPWKSYGTSYPDLLKKIRDFRRSDVITILYIGRSKAEKRPAPHPAGFVYNNARYTFFIRNRFIRNLVLDLPKFKKLLKPRFTGYF